MIGAETLRRLPARRFFDWAVSPVNFFHPLCKVSSRRRKRGEIMNRQNTRNIFSPVEFNNSTPYNQVSPGESICPLFIGSKGG